MTLTPITELAFGARTIRRYRLPNGLGAILLADPASPMIAYQTWFRVGSRHEHAGKTGLAHFFEHLMFNETETLKPGEFDRLLEAVGADTNAATWLDWTYYRENVPRGELDLVMRLEAERMARLVVHDPQVASEREVVASERRAHVEDDVEGFLAEKLYATAYDEHPYRWPTIGWMDDILAYTTSDARSFYDAYYTPNNATVVMVGGFDEQAALEALDRYYGALPGRPVPVERAVVERAQGGERRATFAKEVAADRLLVGWHGCGLGHADYAPVEVLVEILAGSHSSRLYRQLVIDTEICSDVSMEVPHFRHAGLVELRASLSRGHRAAEAESIIYRELAAATQAPPGDEEMERARNRLETRFWRALRHPEGQARSMGHYETTLDDFRRAFDFARNVRAVTAADVARVAGRYFDPSERTVVIAEPERPVSARARRAS